MLLTTNHVQNDVGLKEEIGDNPTDFTGIFLLFLSSTSNRFKFNIIWTFIYIATFFFWINVEPQMDGVKHES